MNKILYFSPSEIKILGDIKNSSKLSKKEINFAIQHEIGEKKFQNHQFTYYTDSNNELNIIYFDDKLPTLEKGMEMSVPIYNICRQFITKKSSVSVFGIYSSRVVMVFKGDRLDSYESNIKDEKSFIDTVSQTVIECRASGFEDVALFTDRGFDTIESEVINIDSKDVIKNIKSGDILNKKTFTQNIFEKLNLNLSVKVTMSIEEVINNLQKYGYPFAILVIFGYSVYQNIALKEFYNTASDNLNDIVLVAKDDVKEMVTELKVPMESLEKSISKTDKNIKNFDQRAKELNKEIAQIDSKLDIIIRNSFNRQDRENIVNLTKKDTSPVLTENQKDLKNVLELVQNLEGKYSEQNDSVLSEDDIKNIISKIVSSNSESKEIEKEKGELTLQEEVEKYNIEVAYKSKKYAVIKFYKEDKSDERFKFYPGDNTITHKNLKASLSFDFETDTLIITRDGQKIKEKL